MVSILIKSFNRPHYLDRCLKSIEKHVSGKFEVKIIDDGTPQKYLELIEEKHPNVQIIHTKKYKEKSQQIQNKQEISKVIPSRDWYEVAKKSTEYILVIEDDVWFVAPIELDEIAREMDRYNVNLLKLGWNGMQLENENFTQISQNLNKRKINLFTLNPILMDWLFANKFKFYSILKKLKLISENEFYKYYLFISISSGIHKREYWLKTWENLNESVNEKQQIRNAISYYVKHKSAHFITYFKEEIIKTTFKSSATNSFHLYPVDFDVHEFNFILNEAWLEGKFDSMQNYPKDFSDDYIESFLDKEKTNKAKFENWKKWSDCFKDQYRNLGAKVD
ncbi:MAG TPA: glycosyltransferase [Moheibacter sp.]|nr:glycosyltransferase [Moheibacter sp.]